MDLTKILVWNARGLKNKRAELSKRINRYDIVIITETKAKKTESINISGYEVYRQEKTVTVGKNSGSVAIYVKKNIKAKSIKNLTNISDNIEVLGIKVKLEEGKNLNICDIAMYTTSSMIKTNKFRLENSIDTVYKNLQN